MVAGGGCPSGRVAATAAWAVAARGGWRPPGRCRPRLRRLWPRGTMLLDGALGEQMERELFFSTMVRHSSEAWICDLEESSEPRCVQLAAVRHTSKPGQGALAPGWQHTRVRNTRFDSVSSRALKPSKRCRSAIAPNTPHGLCYQLLSLGIAHAVAHAAAQRSPAQGSRTTKETRDYIDSATTPRL